MHGEEEARLVLEDGFSHDNERGEKKQLSAAGLVEDPVFMDVGFGSQPKCFKGMYLSSAGYRWCPAG